MHAIDCSCAPALFSASSDGAIGNRQILNYAFGQFFSIFRLDALAKALSVIATATWLGGRLGGWVAGWLGVCHSRYCIKTTKPIRKRFGPSGRPII